MTTPLANASAIRASDYSARVFAGFYAPPTPVASGTIFTAPGAPYTDIGVTYVVGSHTDVLYGMEVVFSDQITGNFKGRTHVRFAGVINVNNLPIREYSLAQFDLNVGDTFEIFVEWRIHDKLPAATVTFDPDWLVYTDQNANPPPVACSGGHYAAWVDGYDTATVLAYATVQMTGSTSYTVDPDSGGSVTHLWTLPTGVTFAGGSVDSDADPVLHAVPGEYLVYHDVTDDDNGNTTTQHIIIEVYDDTRTPYEVGITSYSGTQDSGFGFSLELMSGDGSLTAIPDGCWCILFTHEMVNGAWQAFRNAAPGRTTIIGVGIVRRDTNSGDASGYNKLVFDVESPLARLHEMTSYSKAMLDGVLTEWDSVKTLGVKRAAEQIFLFYTTLIEAGCDIVFDADFIDYRYPAFYLQRSDFIGQFNELINAVDAVMSCDRTGRIDLHTYPAYIPLASRAAVTTSWHFVPSDILSWQFTREQIAIVEQMKVSGFTGGASNNQPIFALGPGAAPDEGLTAGDKARLIVADDGGVDITERAGRYQAEANLSFRDTDGTLYRLSELRLTLRGVYNFFDFRKEYADFTTTLTNRRSVDLTPFKFFLTNLSVSFDSSGSPQTQLTFKPAFNASAGTLYIPPADNFTPPPITPVQPPILISPYPSSGLGSGVNTLAAFNADGNVYLAQNFVSQPYWTSYSLAGLGMSGTLVMFIVDAYSPRYLGTGSQVNGMIVTTTDAYWITDIGGSSPALSHSYALRYTTGFRCMQSERGIEGFFAIVSHQDDAKVDLDVTQDRGATWTNYPDIGGAWVGGFGDTIAPGVYVSARVPGEIIFSAYTGSGATTTGRLYRATSYGASISTLDSNTTYNINPGLTIPFQNTAESVIYWGGADPGSGFMRFHVLKTVSGVMSDISPVVGGETYGTGDVSNQFGLKTCDIDQNTVLLVGQNRDASGTVLFGVFLSHDGGATWTTVISPSSGTRYSGGNIAGDNPNGLFLWGDNTIVVSYDGGMTLIAKDANLPACSFMLNICGL